MPLRRKVASRQIKRKVPEPSGLGSSLFPIASERERWDDFLTRELIQANERVAEGPVRPTLNPDDFRSELAHFDFRHPVRSTNCCRGRSRRWSMASSM